MFKINDYIIYKNEVCLVIDILKNYYRDEDFYVLEPINDKSLSIKIPISNKNNFLRPIISKEGALEVIKNIPFIKPVLVEEKYLDNTYKELLNNRNHESLIKIIKTTYLRNEERRNNNLKEKEKDNVYFNLAEKLLYDEFSIALGKNFSETRDFIINEVKNMENS